MSKKTKAILIVLLALVVIFLFNGPFVVHQKEFVVVKQFGKIVRTYEEPGLYIKTPFVQTVQRVSTATVLYDLPVSDVITKDKKSMIADNYVLWKVTDPTKYIQTLSAVTERANERVEANVYNATKNVISAMTQDEIIAARGDRLTTLITEQANSDIGGYGITILQSQIKVLDLPDDNKEAVYERMISERNNIAAAYKASGDAEAQKIKNETDKKVAVMKADAEKQAAILIAEGEAEYMKILSDAYNNEDKADFYNYIRSLDALKASMTGEEKTIILDKDSEIASMFYGIPEYEFKGTDINIQAEPSEDETPSE
ncbi:MAG: protease modulator HflC [Lachnospiraceae bacterium]|nr:protease modulator HflC [Lachnospiraceae bacterium]MBO7601167.1 protease modulator HflC [Lachnospiraceae bacterium]